MLSTIAYIKCYQIFCYYFAIANVLRIVKGAIYIESSSSPDINIKVSSMILLYLMLQYTVQ